MKRRELIRHLEPTAAGSNARVEVILFIGTPPPAKARPFPAMSTSSSSPPAKSVRGSPSRSRRGSEVGKSYLIQNSPGGGRVIFAPELANPEAPLHELPGEHLNS